MLQTVTMPKLSPTMTQGEIAKWHKAVGEKVSSGELLVEIATDKATIEHFAPSSGYIGKILIPERQTCAIGTPIAIISSEKDASLSGYTPVPVVFDEEQKAPSVSFAPPQKQESKTSPQSRIFSSPLARKIAAQENISLENVVGTGPGGRIMSKDLEKVRLSRAHVSERPVAEKEFPVEEGVQITPLSMLRKTIAQTLQYAKKNIPHFYVCKTIEVSLLVSERDRLKKESIHVTVNDLIVKACALALMKHPSIRSSFYPQLNATGVHPHADIAVAVSVPSGLMTPVIKSAETKSVFTIAKEIKVFAEKARQGGLLPQDYLGGAFTITNLGMYGVEYFIPILNPPQVAILAVGTVHDAPIVKNGAIQVGKVLPLTVAADHRAIDGSDVASFLKTLEEIFSSPELLTKA